MTIIELIQARLDQCRSNPQGDVVAVLSELLEAAVALEAIIDLTKIPKTSIK